ncbi:tyrosine-type recombinase/integrase [Sulfurospirillum sp. 1612]|uniref:tyrosine-type recombinase/integrase n=1 Tax=Sulfurospirillum sp. 1612 TaxID=3094835 RepID=UPI002F95F17F
MRYPLDFEATFSKTYLFWLSKFTRNKITTLSNRNVTDKDRLAQIIQHLAQGSDNIKVLKQWLNDARNIGMGGIHVYFRPLEKLYEYLMRFGAASMREIDEELLSDFLASETSQLSDASKKNYRIALLSFFSYIDKQNSDENGTAYHYGIELKNWGGLGGKGGIKLPSYLNKDEVQRFIAAIDAYEFKTPEIGIRNRLIIKLILYTGIRVGEAIGVKKSDFFKDEDTYVIQVRGKGNKPRVVMIREKIIQSDLLAWLEIHHCHDGLMFCNQKGTKLTQAYLSRIVEQILISAGIRKEKNGCHMLRHTFATLLYQKSHDLILVQESLGHADINTSRIYTHFDKEKLKKTTDIF